VYIHPPFIKNIIKQLIMAQTRPKRKKKVDKILTKNQITPEVKKPVFNEVYENIKRDTIFKRVESLKEQESIKKEQEERLEEGKKPIKPSIPSRGYVKDKKLGVKKKR
jgi:hypothetical protein